MSTKYFCLASLLVWGCGTEKEWLFEENIIIPEVFPIGIVLVDNDFIVSDPDNNRLVRVDGSGNILKEWGGFQRPMHITEINSTVYVPEFISDSLKVLEEDMIKSFDIDASFDAPAAIDINESTLAVADFYNHRILLSQNGQISSIGVECHEDGKLYYPTDVKIYRDKIFVADAYNNRIQVFDKTGQSVKIIGWKEDIAVATGIEVFDDQVFVTDFYGNRVLVYDLKGRLKKVYSDQFDGPTDILVTKDHMYVANYKGGYIAVYRKE